jgi:hypothetical protein
MGSAQAGPIDVVMLKFEGNKFNGGIAPALRDLVVQRLIRIADLLFVFKDSDGTVGSLEIADLSAELEPSFVDIDGQFEGGLLDAEDVEEVGATLEPDTSVAIVVVENLWAIPFIAAVRSAGGELIDQVRVPSAVVDAVRDELSQA